jgi:dimethylamine/trimethylamine dehydrogenase
MRDPRFDVLFAPIQIGPKIMKNRFYQVPYATGFGTERPGAQTRFRGVRAEGGWGAVSVEYCSIHPEADDSPLTNVTLHDEHDLRALKMIVEETHAHGSLAALELWHGGVTGLAWSSRLPPAAPTQIPFHHGAYGAVYPRTVDADDIREIQGWFAEAARKAVEIGFDIVYVYGAFSYLPMQFLSADFNKRTDEYGGSLENRARFWIETLEAVQKAVSGKAAVASRISLESLGPGGVTIDESLEFISMADPHVDLWDVVIGSIMNEPLEIAPSRLSSTYHMKEWTSRVKKYTSKPVLGVGRFTNPDLMVDIINRGELDIIGAARPSIADPFLPKKIEEGRFSDIRECIGCNFCLQRGVLGNQIACTQNATAGEEYRRGWHPERFTRAANADQAVVIIGAGAAGLECARVLGERGMEAVHIVEAGSEVGGYAGMVASLPGLAEWRRVVEWREYQLQQKSNVEIIRNTRLDADGAVAYGGNIVIVANGSRWARDGRNHVTGAAIPGHDQTHVLTPEDILQRKVDTGETVLVYDCDGHVIGAGIAELLARRGKKVTLVTPHGRIAPYTDQTLDSPNFRRTLRNAGIEMMASTTLLAIGPDHCRIKGRGIGEREIAAQTVVLATARVSDDALFRAIKARREAFEDNGITGVYAIGDCVAPRMIGDAVFDGHRLAREIDSANPRWPLPLIREVLPG